MVDLKGCAPLHLLPRPGGGPAANGFLQDVCLGKEWRKQLTVWKLLLVVVLAGSGLYLCLLGVGLPATRQIPYEPVEDWRAGKDWASIEEDPACTPNPKRGSSSSSSSVGGFVQHYPLPHTYHRNECTCTPVHYFVILSMQRSGSGWLETLLNNHPNISSHGEIFSVSPRRDNFTSIARNMDVVFNLDWSNSASKNECTAAVGFKWMLNQGPVTYQKEVLEYFKRMGVSIILLRRRNVLKRLISIMANDFDRREKLLNGTHKSHVHSLEEAMKLAEYKPVINVTNLPENLQTVEDTVGAAQRFFQSLRMKVVYYEDLVMNPQRLTEAQEFLGVTPRKLESQQVKIHTRPLREQIQNWEEVLSRLKGTKYEAFVQDEDYT